MSDKKPFTFYTRPRQAKVYISYDDMSDKGEYKGCSGAPMLLDLSQMRGKETIGITFERDGFGEKHIKIKPEYFLSHDRYPETGQVMLRSNHVRVIFNTYPDKADVFMRVDTTHGYADSFLGKSGEEIDWNLSTHPATGQSYFVIKYWGYKDKEIPDAKILPFGDTGEVVHHPSMTDRTSLEPAIPIIIPFLHWVRRNPWHFLSSIVLLCVVSFTIIIPHLKRVKRLQAVASLQEAEAGLGDSIIGCRIGLYRLLEKLGEGGMARVYKADSDPDMEGKGLAAIKIMQSDPENDEEFGKRFKREIRISSALNHPNIVKILDFGDQNGLCYMAMELVEGETLRRIIPAAGFDLERFLDIFGQILSGLEYAHSKGIMHRDLKPENIMIRPNGKVVIMDFGLAWGRDYSAITKTGTTLGTPVYMSPEQITTKEIDERSDQYSLGVIAYQMLTGKVPFWDENTVNIIFMHIRDESPPLRESRPDLPGWVAEMVRRMLEKEKDKRFPNIGNVKEFIESSMKK